MDEAAAIAEAEGYLMLGMHEEAWEFIDFLPASLRMSEHVLRCRVICAMALERFEMAEELARFLARHGSATVKFAAHILQDLAALNYISGNIDHTLSLIAAAVKAHPAQRLSIIDDPTLKDLF